MWQSINRNKNDNRLKRVSNVTIVVERAVKGDSRDRAMWTQASRHVFNSMLNANRAALTSLGFGGSTTRARASTNRQPTPDIEDWEVDRTVVEYEAIDIGDVVEFTKTITDDDVKSFAVASGDLNPLHLDEEYAEGTRFEDRIVHGMLVSGLVSAALARLPGLTVYVSQDTRFLSPVEIGDRLTARCEIVEETSNDLYRLSTDILNEEGETVVDGEAVVLIEESPEED